MSLLSRAATAGVFEFSPADFEQLVRSCDEACNLGDSRYCILRDIFSAIDKWRSEHDGAGGVPRSVLEDIDVSITRYLDDILDAETAAVAAPLAAMLRSDVAAQLTGPSAWNNDSD